MFTVSIAHLKDPSLDDDFGWKVGEGREEKSREGREGGPGKGGRLAKVGHDRRIQGHEVSPIRRGWIWRRRRWLSPPLLISREDAVMEDDVVHFNHTCSRFLQDDRGALRPFPDFLFSLVKDLNSRPGSPHWCGSAQSLLSKTTQKGSVESWWETLSVGRHRVTDQPHDGEGHSA